MATICNFLLTQFNCSIFIKGMYYVQLIINADEMEMVLDGFYGFHIYPFCIFEQIFRRNHGLLKSMILFFKVNVSVMV